MRKPWKTVVPILILVLVTLIAVPIPGTEKETAVGASAESVEQTRETGEPAPSPTPESRPKNPEAAAGLQLIGLPEPATPLPARFSILREGGSSMEVNLTSHGTHGWTGEVAGEPGSFVSLSRVGDAFEGQIMSVKSGEWILSGELGIRPFSLIRSPAEHGFCSHDLERFTVKDEALLPAGDEVIGGFGNGPALPMGDAEEGDESDALPVVRVLFLYTPKAKETAGTENAMQAIFNQMLNSLNAIMGSSEAGATAEFAGKVEVPYNIDPNHDGNTSTALNRLANGTDGFFDNVGALRNQFSADMATIVIKESSSGAGLGVSQVNGPYSAHNYATIAGVGPHEIGHGMGCGHNGTGAGPVGSQTALQGVYSYSRAHFFDYMGDQRGTIMSNIGQRFSRFSNPEVNWNGIPTGTAGRNHALTITNNAPNVESWKPFTAGDLDNDGLADADEIPGDFDLDWQQNAYDPDADGDGMEDGAEVIAARNPFDGLPQFNFIGTDDEGWDSSTNVTGRMVAGGVLKGTSSSTDPQVNRSGLYLSGDRIDTLLVRIKSSKTGSFQIFWGTTENDGIAGTRSISVPVTVANEFQILSLPVGLDEDWQGKTITRFRLDPINQDEADFEIDFIGGSDGDLDGDGLTDPAEGYGDFDGDGYPDLADADKDGDSLGDAKETDWGLDPLDGTPFFEFDHPGDAEGWAPKNLGPVSVTGGSLTGPATSGDPQLANSKFHLAGDRVRRVAVKLSLPTNDTIQLFWSTTEASGFSALRSVTSAYTGAGAQRTVVLELAENTEWDGKTVTALRLDPGTANSAALDIDWIRFSDGDLDKDGIPDLTEGAMDTDGDGIADLADEDSDNDGAPDAWEFANGLNTKSNADLTLDDDGDGLANVSEYIAGTDPNDSTSTLRAVVSQASPPSPVTVGADGKAGRKYALLRSPDLASETWLQVDESAVLATDAAIQLTDPSPLADKGFYRISVTWP